MPTFRIISTIAYKDGKVGTYSAAIDPTNNIVVPGRDTKEEWELFSWPPFLSCMREIGFPLSDDFVPVSTAHISDIAWSVGLEGPGGSASDKISFTSDGYCINDLEPPVCCNATQLPDLPQEVVSPSIVVPPSIFVSPSLSPSPSVSPSTSISIPPSPSTTPSPSVGPTSGSPSPSPSQSEEFESESPSLSMSPSPSPSPSPSEFVPPLPSPSQEIPNPGARTVRRWTFEDPSGPIYSANPNIPNESIQGQSGTKRIDGYVFATGTSVRLTSTCNMTLPNQAGSLGTFNNGVRVSSRFRFRVVNSADTLVITLKSPNGYSMTFGLTGGLNSQVTWTWTDGVFARFHAIEFDPASVDKLHQMEMIWGEDGELRGALINLVDETVKSVSDRLGGPMRNTIFWTLDLETTRGFQQETTMTDLAIIDSGAPPV